MAAQADELLLEKLRALPSERRAVRSVTTVHVAALEHLARQETGTPLSVRNWIREGKGVLLLPYRAGDLAALRCVISTWMRLAMFEVMNAAEG